MFKEQTYVVLVSKPLKQGLWAHVMNSPLGVVHIKTNFEMCGWSKLKTM
jgi:hypothetical protein